jgi:hypothetical protein
MPNVAAEIAALAQTFATSIVAAINGAMGRA